MAEWQIGAQVECVRGNWTWAEPERYVVKVPERYRIYTIRNMAMLIEDKRRIFILLEEIVNPRPDGRNEVAFSIAGFRLLPKCSIQVFRDMLVEGRG